MPQLGGMTGAQALEGAGRLARMLRRAGRPSPSQLLTLTVDVAGFTSAMRRAADGLRALEARWIEHLQVDLLAARRAVDVTATAAPDWISPACRGFLCDSCSPYVSCSHRCHPEGTTR